MPASEIRIGVSGWRYAPWRGEFYPRGLVQRSELAYASRAVDDRDQRLVLLAAASIELGRVVRRDARGPRRSARAVYCYFDNTDKLQAPLDAKRLMARLGLDVPERAAVPPR